MKVTCVCGKPIALFGLESADFAIDALGDIDLMCENCESWGTLLVEREPDLNVTFLPFTKESPP